jgi:peroxidase
MTDNTKAKFTMEKLLVLCLLPLVLSQVVNPPDASKWRPINGYGLNPLNPLWGTPGIHLERQGFAQYGDGISSPRTALLSGDPLPSPRLVSNKVFTHSGAIPRSPRGLNDFVTYWGQFIDHDFSLSSGDPSGFYYPPIRMDIPVPAFDPYFDPQGLGTVTLPFLRGKADPMYGGSVDYPWAPLNLVTAWFDGSQVYGSDNVTASYIRTFTDGLLKSQILGGQEYPVWNDGSVVLMQSAGIQSQNQLFLLGDVRGNENPGLTSLHILFLREHNLRARTLKLLNPTWTDEMLYQEARKLVIAIMHHITEEEYLPVTLGLHLEEYQYFDSSVSPNIFAEFSTGAFRYGHTEVNAQFLQYDANLNNLGSINLMSSYFNPAQTILANGVDPIVRGMLMQPQGAVDTVFVDDLRNYLFGQPGSGGLDLTAINIQRGRDHGLPGINTYRDNYNLPAYTQWSQINPNPAVWQALASVYESIDDCDVYVCGLAELPYTKLSNLGETFHTAVKEQYTKIRNSDPFWYEADNYLTDDELIFVHDTDLAAIIQRNSGVTPQCLAMALPDGCGIAIPSIDKPSIAPPANVDFMVTLTVTEASNPQYGMENYYSFTINGINGNNIQVTRGNTYVFYTQTSCNHAFSIVTSPDVDVPPFAPFYDNVVNQQACIDQTPILTLFVDWDAPDNLYYTCALHNNMGGVITVVGSNISTNNPATSAQAPQSLVTASSGKSVSAGTVVAAVVIPVLAVVILILSVLLFRARTRSPVVLKTQTEGISRRESSVKLEE